MDVVKTLTEKLSIEQVKIELLNTAYGYHRTFLQRLDPRTLFLWYLVFGVVPFFIHHTPVLIGLALFLIILTVMAKVSPLIIFILTLGLLTQGGSYLIVGLFFGGEVTAMLPLLKLTLKLSVISMASIVVFCSMSPEKLSDGLLKIGVPGQVSFSIGYAYRMLPTLVEEYHHIFLSYRLRGKAPKKKGFLYSRHLYYYIKLLIKSFYPLMLSVAKRSRTMVEALESKGSLYGFNHPKVKQLKLQHLKINKRDVLFFALSLTYFLTLIGLS
jgi:energy-coupling factor transport system permease protein